MTDLAIDPAVLTAGVAVNRFAELVDIYFQHNPPGPYQRDAADELIALAAGWRAKAALDPGLHLAWPEQDHEPVPGVDYLPTDDDLHGCHPEFAVRPGHIVTDVDLLTGTDQEWATALGVRAA